MKRLLKVGIKILFFMAMPLIVYILSYSLLTLLFIFAQEFFPLFRLIEQDIYREAAILFSGVNIAIISFVVYIKPILHVIHWIQGLSQGTYREPGTIALAADTTDNRKYLSSGGISFLYKDLFEQMELLTNKLKQNELDREYAEVSRREWISGITHDLKTPLSYIQGYSSMIAAKQYTWSYEEVKDFGMKIEEKSHHIKNLIDDLNISLQSDSGKIILQKNKIEMIEFLRNTVVDSANSPRSSEYLFSFVTDISSYDMILDKVLIQRALQNVLMNAVLHNPPGTKIEVAVNKKSKLLNIYITDNGKGMEEEAASKLFERYYRGTPTDIPSEGSGLGLAIARQLIELHGGIICAHSIKEQGTTISISLPG